MKETDWIMFESLANAGAGGGFTDLAGTCSAKGKALQLPFGKQFEELLREPKNGGTLNHVVNVVAPKTPSASSCAN